MRFATITPLIISAALTVLFGGFVRTNQPATRLPIIDTHLHAYGAANWRGPSPNPVTGKPGPATADEHMRQTLAAMTEHNIVKAIVSGPLEAVEKWRSASPDRILASPNFGRAGVDLGGQPLPTVEARDSFKSGRLNAIGEVQAQYEGLSPSDPSLDPYFTLAESLDIPVGIHTSCD